MVPDPWLDQIRAGCMRALTEQDLDPFSPTFGCFDRRYWGWKLTDFPEATFQRNVYPLAWLGQRLTSSEHQKDRQLASSLLRAANAGIRYAASLQHPNGSFDQAFPFEQSYGATAFLLHPLLKTAKILGDNLDADLGTILHKLALRASRFLMEEDERHGLISNHIAGAALSLQTAGAFLGDEHLYLRADTLIKRILKHQSDEGWMLEYEGADPGYQSLCLHYLAQLDPAPAALVPALTKAVAFLAHFVHPDGTFGGLYGSRRTSLFYPGGLAVLARQSSVAAAILAVLSETVAEDKTPGPRRIDFGNLAPLLSSYVLAEESRNTVPPARAELPRAKTNLSADFPEAGIYVRSTATKYLIFGASNGGVAYVFTKDKSGIGEALLRDGGYAGTTQKKVAITTQITTLPPSVAIEPDRLLVTAPLYHRLNQLPTPSRFVLLRLLNLTVMRNLWLAEKVKAILVRLLITGKKSLRASVRREITLTDEQIHICDTLIDPDGEVKTLAGGVVFRGIHMASSGYFEGGEQTNNTPYELDSNTHREQIL